MAKMEGEFIWSISPRMAPLEKKGLIIRCKPKEYRINSNGKMSLQTVWKAAKPPRVQHDLFGGDAFARHADPVTSKEAAKRVRVAKLEAMVVNFLNDVYPRTFSSIEIERHLRGRS